MIKNRPQNLKSYVLIFFSGLIFCLFVYVLLSFSLLNIKNETTSTVNIKITNPDTHYSDDFVQEPSTSSYKLLRRGSYNIEYSSGDKKTLLAENMGYFDIKSLTANLHSQKMSQNIGIDPSVGCFFAIKSEGYLKYPCREDENVSPYLFKQDASVEYIEHSDGDNNSGQSYYVPYKDMLLVFEQNDKKLHTSALLSSPELKQQKITDLDVSSQLNNNLISADSSGSENGYFGFIDDKELVYFSDINNQQAQRIDLSNKIKPLDGYSTKLTMSGDFAYVFSGYDSSLLGTDESAEFNDGQQILLIINMKNKVIDEYKDFSNSIVDEFSASNNKIYVSSSSAKKDYKQSYYIDQLSGSKTLLPYTETSSICSVDGGLYYKNNNDLFYYEQQDNQSRLVYSSTKPLSMVSCYKNRAYISLVDIEKGKYIHIELLDAELSGQRIENILPLYNLDYANIVSATVYKDQINVKLLNSDAYFNREDSEYKPGTAYFETDKNKAFQELKNKNVALEKYKINYSY